MTIRPPKNDKGGLDLKILGAISEDSGFEKVVKEFSKSVSESMRDGMFSSDSITINLEPESTDEDLNENQDKLAENDGSNDFVVVTEMEDTKDINHALSLGKRVELWHNSQRYHVTKFGAFSYNLSPVGEW